MSTEARRAQRDDALERANQARIHGQQIRIEVATGLLTLTDALDDPRAQAVPIGRLLLAQRNWGKARTDALCKRLSLWPMRRVRDLTAHQRHVIRIATTRD